MKLILGSSSPSRRQLLSKLGYEFEVMSPDIDEKAIRHQDPKELTLALANAKLDALLKRVKEPSVILTSDQVGFHDGTIREKPADEAEARYFLKTVSNEPVRFVGSIAVANTQTGARSSGTYSASFKLAPVPDELIDTLIAEGYVMRCAGAVKLEDPRMQELLISLEGGLDSVMGLNKEMADRLIKEVS